MVTHGDLANLQTIVMSTQSVVNVGAVTFETAKKEKVHSARSVSAGLEVQKNQVTRVGIGTSQMVTKPETGL